MASRGRPKKENNEVQKVTFRLPQELYDIIQEMAERETRPINSQTIVLLREAIAARQASTPAQSK